MSVLSTAEELLKSIPAYNKAADGDSGDAEHDAANEMRNAAESFLRAVAGRDVELAELIDRYESSLHPDEDDEEDEENL